MPMPVITRQMRIPGVVVWQAITIAPTVYHSSEYVKIVRRPSLSAANPNASVPMKRPANVAATKLDANLETDTGGADPLGAIGNLCGLPAISVPCGFDASGLPVGLQFVGRSGDDAAVLEAGQIFQRATQWHRKHPKLA